MRDDQTGTFWQQISGRAISGPLAGSQLELVYSDELTVSLWRKEAPDGSVLRPVAKYVGDYASKDWDVHMAEVRTVLDFPNTGLHSRDLVLGIDAFGVNRAYPVARIFTDKLIEDRLGGRSILIVLGPDGKSIRVFEAHLPGGHASSEFYRKLGNIDANHAAEAAVFMDSATGSEWNFSGCAVSGKLKGSRLSSIPAVKDYWFDWRNYHPNTSIFQRK